MVKLILMLIIISCGGSSGGGGRSASAPVNRNVPNTTPKISQNILDNNLLDAIQKEDLLKITNAIKEGGDINKSDVLIRGIWTNNENVLRLLLDAGAKADVDKLTSHQQKTLNAILKRKITKEENVSKAKEKAEIVAREEEAERVAKEEEERVAREEEAERLAKEEERVAREEAERLAKEENVSKAKEKAERVAKKEVELKAREEAARLAKEKAERVAKEEAARLAKEKAERVAKEEAARLAREKAERVAKEEAERLAKEELKEKGLIRLLNNGKLDDFSLLLNMEDVNVNEVDENGNNILNLAIQKLFLPYINREEYIKIIDKILTSEKIDINKKNNVRQSPLFTLIHDYRSISHGYDGEQKNFCNDILDKLLAKKVDISYINVSDSFLVKAVASAFLYAVEKLLDEEVTFEEVKEAVDYAKFLSTHADFAMNNINILSISLKLEEKIKSLKDMQNS